MSKEKGTELSERAAAKAWIMGAVAWLFPGAGHALQGYWARALLVGGVVWTTFIGGLWMGGYFFKFTGAEQGISSLLQILPMIGNLGTGLLYLGCWRLGVGFSYGPEQAAPATFEYGWKFLLIAGLLNYLAMLDAFDLAARRKS